MLDQRSGWWLVLVASLGCGPIGSEVVEIYDGQSSASSGSGSATLGGGSGDRGSTGPVADGSGSATAAGASTGMVTQGGTTQGVDPGTSTGNASATSDATSAGSSSEGPMGTSTGDPPTCAEIFGAASGYVLCMEDASSCAFNVNTGMNSCTTICSTYGETCLDAIDNPGGAGTECTVQGPSFCDNNSKGTTICVCSR